jgi:hypothetical protein
MASLELSNALYSAIRHCPHVDVLIDPLANEEWRELEAAVGSEADRVCILKDKAFEARPTQAPTLLRIPLSQYEAVESWLTLAEREASGAELEARLVCAFVASDLPLADLSEQLSSRLTAQAVSRAMYFRYFDPRVRRHLPRLLTPEQWAYLLPGQIRWFHVERGSELVTGEAKTGGPHPAHALRFDADQWFAVETIEHFNVTLQALNQRDIHAPVSKMEALFERVMAARRCGLREPRDVAHYVLASILLGEELKTKLPWEQVLDALSGGSKLSELLPL